MTKILGVQGVLGDSGARMKSLSPKPETGCVEASLS